MDSMVGVGRVWAIDVVRGEVQMRLLAGAEEDCWQEEAGRLEGSSGGEAMMRECGIDQQYMYKIWRL